LAGGPGVQSGLKLGKEIIRKMIKEAEIMIIEKYILCSIVIDFISYVTVLYV
jgi:hypothetical protein